MEDFLIKLRPLINDSEWPAIALAIIIVIISFLGFKETDE